MFRLAIGIPDTRETRNPRNHIDPIVSTSRGARSPGHDAAAGTANRESNIEADSLDSKKHQKRLSAPSSWMLDKLGGTYAPKVSAGPHKARDCLPLIIFIRNRLRYALN